MSQQIDCWFLICYSEFMFSVDKKFSSFSLEVYNPEKEEIQKIANKNFSGRWLILFFYPADFTFVCPTELFDLKKFSPEFKIDEIIRFVPSNWSVDIDPRSIL